MDTIPQRLLRRFLKNPLVIGLVAVLMLGLVLGELTEDVLEKESIVSLDHWVLENTHIIQSPGLTRIMIFVSILGGAYILWPAAVLSAAWLFSKKRFAEAKFFVAVMAGGEILNLVLKYIIHRARPIPPGGADLTHAWGWSYPSGHAFLSVVFYFTVACLVSRRFNSKIAGVSAYAIASCIAGLIALSRVYLQVHYLSDILAGLVAGLAWFILCLVILEYYRKARV